MSDDVLKKVLQNPELNNWLADGMRLGYITAVEAYDIIVRFVGNR